MKASSTPRKSKTGRSTVQRLEDRQDKKMENNDSSESEAEDLPVLPRKARKKVRVASPEAEEIDDDFPELPFEKTPAVAYVPLGHNRRPEHELIPNLEPRETSYKTQAPIENAEESLKLMERMMNTPFTVTAREMLSTSKEVRDFFRSKVTKKRVPVDKKPPDPQKSVNYNGVNSEEPIQDEEEDALEYWENWFKEQNQPTDMVEIEELPKATFSITISTKGDVPAGSVILDDPVAQYYDSLAPGDTPQTIYVARESQGLRAIYPVVNKTLEEEAVLDGGSQIVSMSKEVALKLGISWDPDIVIHMQSANKQVEKTLGLARNVPFVFNDITLYLQVHVVNEPAYRVLLGRPFDSLTESVIHNDRDGGQIITITDPNSGKRSTLPTYQRGKPPDIRKAYPKDVFQRSMN